MRNKLMQILKLTCVSCVAALLCTFCIYKFFPQYLCYIVYDVHESQLYEKEDKLVEANAQYTETFVSTSPYIKAIAFNLKERDENAVTGKYIEGKLIDSSGKILAVEQYQLKESIVDIYCEFPFEQWVVPGEAYQFVINFPDCEDVYVTFGPGDVGPAEHIKLTCNGNSMSQNLYLRYIYGQYSKKLLVMWFLVFFISAYMLGELLGNCRKK